MKPLTRNSIAFWLLGLFNNASYVIMIAGAKSISEGGVGLVFLADVAPTFLIKLTAPYWFHLVSYQVRVVAATVLMMLSFILIAVGTVPMALTKQAETDSSHGIFGVQIAGVLLASAQSGIGEATFLARASYYEQRTMLTMWSSGTGFAGIFGFAWVQLFTEGLKLTFQGTCVAAISLALGYASVYFWVLLPPDWERINEPANEQQLAFEKEYSSSRNASDARRRMPRRNEDDGEAVQNPGVAGVRVEEEYEALEMKDSSELSCEERFRFICSLTVYIVPLAIVYFAEYAMQSGTWAAIGFPVDDKDARKIFYSYANWTYQAGVFCSRSSGLLFQANMLVLWLMPLLQTVMLVLFSFIAVYQFWYGYGLLVLCFITGLLGGAVYVNAFTLIAKNLPPQRVELALSTASIGDSMGIILSDVFGLFLQSCIYKANGIPGADVSCPISW